jgi:hypothetical protein
MATKCVACNSSIWLGGTSWAGMTCCNDTCVSNLKVALVDKLIPAADVERMISEVHDGACMVCKKPGPNDIYHARKVTGMLVAVQWTTERHICCAPCARNKKLLAFLHCATLGWWSPKAILINVFYLPYNLLGLAFTNPTPTPSRELVTTVKGILADRNAAVISAAVRATPKA